MSSASELIEQGMDAFAREAWEEATDRLGQATVAEDFPADRREEVFEHLADAYFYRDEYALGVQALTMIGRSEADGLSRWYEVRRMRFGEGSGEVARDLYEQADLAYKDGRYEDARALFEQLSQHPGVPADGRAAVAQDLGRCWFHLNNWDEGYRVMAAGGVPEETIRADWSMVRGTDTGTGTTAQPSLAPEDESAARELYTQAREAYDGHRWEDAKGLFEQLTGHPGVPADGRAAVAQDLGRCWFHLNNWDEGYRVMAAGGVPEETIRADWQMIQAQPAEAA